MNMIDVCCRVLLVTNQVFMLGFVVVTATYTLFGLGRLTFSESENWGYYNYSPHSLFRL